VLFRLDRCFSLLLLLQLHPCRLLLLLLLRLLLLP
jgi:hypothetical protein